MLKVDEIYLNLCPDKQHQYSLLFRPVSIKLVLQTDVVQTTVGKSKILLVHIISKEPNNYDLIVQCCMQHLSSF